MNFTKQQLAMTLTCQCGEESKTLKEWALIGYEIYVITSARYHSLIYLCRSMTLEEMDL